MTVEPQAEAVEALEPTGSRLAAIPGIRTLADVLTCIADAKLSRSKKRDRRWAINTFSKAAGLTPRRRAGKR